MNCFTVNTYYII